MSVFCILDTSPISSINSHPEEPLSHIPDAPPEAQQDGQPTGRPPTGSGEACCKHHLLHFFCFLLFNVIIFKVFQDFFGRKMEKHDWMTA